MDSFSCPQGEDHGRSESTPENEDYLLVIAEYGTAQHVETLVRKYQRAVRLNDPKQAESQHKAREFYSYHDDDGMFVFNGKLPAEQGAVFLKAINTILGKLREEADLEKKASAEGEENEEVDDNSQSDNADKPEVKNVPADQIVGNNLVQH